MVDINYLVNSKTVTYCFEFGIYQSVLYVPSIHTVYVMHTCFVLLCAGALATSWTRTIYACFEFHVQVCYE